MPGIEASDTPLRECGRAGLMGRMSGLDLALYGAALATLIGVPLYAWMVRGRQYSIFGFVILAVSLPGALVLHARLDEMFPGLAPLVTLAFFYGMASTAGHLAGGAGADRPAVDLDHRCQATERPGDESLVEDVVRVDEQPRRLAVVGPDVEELAVGVGEGAAHDAEATARGQVLPIERDAVRIGGRRLGVDDGAHRRTEDSRDE